MLIYYMFFNEHGEVSEWSKVLDSKSSVVNSHRGFESHPLCHLQISPCSAAGTFLLSVSYIIGNKKSGLSLRERPDPLQALFCCFDDFFAVIVTAFRANVMRHFRFVALRAGNEAGSFELPVSTALVAACLRSFALWYCHLIFTSEVRVPSVKSMQWVDAGWIHFT